MEKEYSTKVGDYLIIWITGNLALHVAEITHEDPLQMKVEEHGPYAHLKSGDYIIHVDLTKQFQKEGKIDQKVTHALKSLEEKELCPLGG